MLSERLNYLIKQYSLKRISLEERVELLAILQEMHEFESRYDAESHLDSDLNLTDTPLPIDPEAILAAVFAVDTVSTTPEINENSNGSPGIRSGPMTIVNSDVGRFAWIWYAAAVLLVVLLTTWSVRYIGDQSIVRSGSKLVVAHISPGTDQAILTLPDGTVIPLDSIAEGVVVKQGSVWVSKLPNGVLRYDNKAGKTTGTAGVALNTLTTPRGGQHQLILPDGSRVWLNSASSIQFPSEFDSFQRHVKLTGEAYFEVSEDVSKPFLVSVDRETKIQVLGTSFNVNSYSNESFLRATLISGAIRVTKGSRSLVINPGEQAQVGEGVEVNSQVNIEKVVAWKNGLFNFDGLALSEVMKQLERWYDIDVVYENGIPDVVIGGEMSRDIPLSGLLAILEKLEIRYKLEGRKLTILQHKD